MSELMKLSQTHVGDQCIVKNIKAKGLLKQRLLDLGVIYDTKIYVLRKSPWGDPTAYIIRDTCIALRKEEAGDILVEVL
ncbi:ferrous iron transport protein A [Clostridium niameyense]|uniref:Ferrous iron transport protein A n=1 Tax=Clostridium niameyense TaxID=1622073 RepID=A0A6M0RBJ1_9CLOT|nr:FeoA family protein [Clostridium niameyense]NEZ47030.1 ferrous iron transport protein A [Clostridium niameyense]